MAKCLIPQWCPTTYSAYPNAFEQAIARTEELVRKANDILENRIEANLDAISQSRLIDLPKVCSGASSWTRRSNLSTSSSGRAHSLVMAC